ncbi:hypothetical protein SLA2020_262490 [Shorea laevis]
MRLLRLSLLLSLTSGLAAIVVYITGFSTLYGKYQPSDEDFEALQSLQSDFQKCVSANGLGLQAAGGKIIVKSGYTSLATLSPNGEILKW